MEASSGSQAPRFITVKCPTCGVDLEYKPCASDTRGNRGRLVAVCSRFHRPDEGSEEVQCKTVLWLPGSSKSPSPSTNTAQPPAITPIKVPFDPSQPETLPSSCSIGKCNTSRLTIKCEYRPIICKKHCLELGGCAFHKPRKDPIAPPPTSSRAPEAASATHHPGPSAPKPSASGTQPTHDVQIPLPAASTATASSMRIVNPNPHLTRDSHLAPVFVDDVRERLQRSQAKQSSQAASKQALELSKKTILTHTTRWLKSDSLPPPSAELGVRQIYNDRIDTWVVFKPGASIPVSEGGKLCFRYSSVTRCTNFDQLRQATRDPPSLRKDLASERAYVRHETKAFHQQTQQASSSTASLAAAQLSTNHPYPSSQTSARQALKKAHSAPPGPSLPQDRAAVVPPPLHRIKTEPGVASTRLPPTSSRTPRVIKQEPGVVPARIPPASSHTPRATKQKPADPSASLKRPHISPSSSADISFSSSSEIEIISGPSTAPPKKPQPSKKQRPSKKPHRTHLEPIDDFSDIELISGPAIPSTSAKGKGKEVEVITISSDVEETGLDLDDNDLDLDFDNEDLFSKPSGSSSRPRGQKTNEDTPIKLFPNDYYASDIIQCLEEMKSSRGPGRRKHKDIFESWFPGVSVQYSRSTMFDLKKRWNFLDLERRSEVLALGEVEEAEWGRVMAGVPSVKKAAKEEKGQAGVNDRRKNTVSKRPRTSGGA
ncbi:hypothetical protein BKA70DRAFT_1229772 [Coprinopsis sp. MPI-PUGE-AT-0042]|nr:hypothetical protein BKA70DRAFT_1229772 [Coprinopsis sp. MPI-PUGE-AT-0042]